MTALINSCHPGTSGAGLQDHQPAILPRPHRQQVEDLAVDRIPEKESVEH